MNFRERMKLESKAWREDRLTIAPDYFHRLLTQQAPSVLWIAAADALVSVHELVNAEPGDVWVYSNIGALVRPEDVSLMAVVEDAILNHRVTAVVVCGNSHCRAARAVIQASPCTPALAHWLRPLSDLYHHNQQHLRELSTTEQIHQLVQLSIREQVSQLEALPVMHQAHARGHMPVLLGVHLDMGTGQLEEVVCVEPPASVPIADQTKFFVNV